MHVESWLTFLRVIDVQSDFGFYFISLRGAFGEAYGDGDPDTCPCGESNVATVLFVCILCAALGIFLAPLDIWVLSQQMAGKDMSMFN
jgi:hypothetical protein